LISNHYGVKRFSSVALEKFKCFLPQMRLSLVPFKRTIMKILKPVFLTAILAGLLLAPFALSAADSTDSKPRPYLLKTCIVSGDKLGGDMGDPYVYIYKDKKIKDDPGREIKFCCKSCLKDFNKDPKAYLKKIDAAEAKLAKK
jgi:hypothetical protein